MKYSNYLILITTLIFTACSTKQDDLKLNLEKIEHISKANLQKVSIQNIKGFKDDDFEKAFSVFKKDCEKSKRFELFKHVCSSLDDVENKKEFFINNFEIYKLYNDENSDVGTITGYYEPLLYGSRQKTEKYKYPIYKTPNDMITVDLSKIYPELKKYRLRGKLKGNKLIPYDSREQIESKNNDNFEVIAYVDNKVDLFLLQVQGSGKVELDSGEIINVGYSNQNGHKYSSIGKYMLKQGYIDKTTASIQGMREFFNSNPQKVDEILNQNKSYVFFHESNKSATGALGTQLVAKRNIAVDKRYIPLGMPVFVQTKNPVTKEEINTLTIAADVGGAIKGEIRADYFWGFGKEAFKYAGKMKEKVKLYIFIPKK